MQSDHGERGVVAGGRNGAQAELLPAVRTANLLGMEGLQPLPLLVEQGEREVDPIVLESFRAQQSLQHVGVKMTDGDGRTERGHCPAVEIDPQALAASPPIRWDIRMPRRWEGLVADLDRHVAGESSTFAPPPLVRPVVEILVPGFVELATEDLVGPGISHLDRRIRTDRYNQYRHQNVHLPRSSLWRDNAPIQTIVCRARPLDWNGASRYDPMEASVPRLKIGVEIAGLRLPLKKALRAAAQLGVEAVQIDARGEITPRELSQTGLRQLRKMLEDLRLRVSAVAFRTRRGYDTTADLEPRIAATKAAMEFAHALGAGVVVNHVGRVPADQESQPWRTLVEVLGELGRHGHRVGALLAAETGTESGEDLARLLAALPQRAIGVDLDPANLVMGGFSPLEAVAVLGPSILHVHATDAVSEPAAGRGTRAALGHGTADFPALLAALDEHRYQGYLTVTHHAAADPVEETAQAVRYLRGF